jgi:hypothetical protein
VSAGAHRCRVCAAEVRDGALRCERCGAPLGHPTPCPHCRGEGGTSPHAEFRFVCDLCGGPRIPGLDASSSSSGREVAFLRKADAARKARATWRGAAVASGVALVFTVVPFLLLSFIIGPVPLLMFPGVLFTALFGGLLAMAVSRAKARGREIGPVIDGAWVVAATDIARNSSERLTAPGLSQKLGIEEAQADELLALLDVHEAIDGAPSVRPPLRIEAGADAAQAALPPASLIDQAAQEEAAAALGDEAEAKRKKL